MGRDDDAFFLVAVVGLKDMFDDRQQVGEALAHARARLYEGGLAVG